MEKLRIDGEIGGKNWSKREVVNLLRELSRKKEKLNFPLLARRAPDLLIALWTYWKGLRYVEELEPLPESSFCPICGGLVITDHYLGEIVCEDCGYVIADLALAQRYPWLQLAKDLLDLEKKWRMAHAEICFRGEPGTKLIGKLPPEFAARLKRLKEWDWRDYGGYRRGRKHYYEFITELRRICRVLKIPEEFEKKAVELFRKEFGNVDLAWMDKKRIIGGVLWATAKECNLSEGWREKIAKKFKIVPLRRRIWEVCSKCNLGEEILTETDEILMILEEKWDFPIKADNFAEPIIYLASLYCKEKVSYRKLQRVANLSEQTLFDEVRLIARKIGISEKKLREKIELARREAQKATCKARFEKKYGKAKKEVERLIKENPCLPYREIALRLKIPEVKVAEIARKIGIEKKKLMEKEKERLIKENPYADIDLTKISRKERRRLIQEAVQKYPYVPLEVIGKWFGGITRERVRQVAALAGIRRSKWRKRKKRIRLNYTKEIVGKILAEVEERIGVQFNNKDLLTQVFIHRSYLNEHPDFGLPHNERLEFLGDGILDAILKEYLYRNYPHKRESELTELQGFLRSNKRLARIARFLGLNEFLLLSSGEAKNMGKARQHILANTLEALIGAIYLDRGYDVAQKFVKRYLLKDLPRIIETQIFKNAKQCFQEEAQAKFKVTPVYKILKEEGLEHWKHFVVGVFLGKKLIAKGYGASKQEAEEKAARNALRVTRWNERLKK